MYREIDDILAAESYCMRKHAGQFRKFTGLPYHTHCFRVRKWLDLVGATDVVSQCAALIHDVPEDCYTDTTTQVYLFNQIQDLFGPHVMKLVYELTNQYTKEFYPKMKRAERKKKELERICGISREAKLIKCCDRIDNILDFTTNGDLPSYYLKESEDLYWKALDKQTGCPYIEGVLRALVS